MNNIKFIVRRVTFSDCGLDIENNILQAPICDCGCGNYMNVILEDDQEVADFIGGTLEEIDCNWFALFVLLQDNSLMFGFKTDEDEIKIMKLKSKDENEINIDIVRDLHSFYDFHCYGLMEQEKDKESFRIVME